MRILNLALLAAAASLGSAQDLSQLPTCVLGAAVSGLSATGCASTDYKCICSSSKFIATLQSAASEACSPMDYANAEKFAQTLCASVGITLGASSSSTPAQPSTSSTSASSVAASPVSTSPTTTTLMTLAQSTVYVTVCSTSTPATTVATPSGSSNITSTKTASPSASFTGAASAYTYSAFGGVVALAAALFL